MWRIPSVKYHRRPACVLPNYGSEPVQVAPLPASRVHGVMNPRRILKIRLLANSITGMVTAAREAGIAQLVEQLICNQQVIGSIPIAGSVYKEGLDPGQRGSGFGVPGCLGGA